jgi:hypothetical protein
MLHARIRSGCACGGWLGIEITQFYMIFKKKKKSKLVNPPLTGGEKNAEQPVDEPKFLRGLPFFAENGEFGGVKLRFSADGRRF